MKARTVIASLLFPAFLGICLIFGGTSQLDQAREHWLQFTSLGLITLLIYPSTGPHRLRPASGMAAILLLMTLWPLLQLIPLPPQVWQRLGQRDVVAEGYRVLGIDPFPSLPISLAPERTLSSLAALLPPLAMVLLIAAIGRKTGSSIIIRCILGCGVASGFLGLLQAMPGTGLDFRWHENTPTGLPAGFFANANHQATLLLVCLPLLAAIVRSPAKPPGRNDTRFLRQSVLFIYLLIFLTSIWATGVRAGYLLILPVCILSLAIWWNSAHNRIPPLGIAIIVATLFLSLAVTLYSPVLEGTVLADLSFSDRGRQIIIWPASRRMFADHWLTGTGLGTFSKVFPLYEDPASVGPTWVNQAHNEYLQLAIELGLPGIVMMVTGIGTWLTLSARAWLGPPGTHRACRRAASVSLMVVLLHSLVDYPARNPVILVVAAACCTLLVWPDPIHADADGADSGNESAPRGLKI